MAPLANLVIGRSCFGTVTNLVGVVAGGALQLPAALQEASRLTQPIDGAGNLKPLRAFLAHCIEEQQEVRQWFSRLVREITPAIALESCRVQAIGLQMALHTHFC